MIAVAADPATLVSAELFDRLVERIDEDEGVGRDYAERVMRQTLVFLKACADNPTESLSPSNAVDLGWHAFILHTAEYTSFCEKIAGRFIHHTPIRPGEPHSGTLARTVEAVHATGLPVDMLLWSGEADCDNDDGGSGKCSQCHQGCVNSPS